MPVFSDRISDESNLRKEAFLQTYDVENKSIAGCLVVGADPRDGSGWRQLEVVWHWWA